MSREAAMAAATGQPAPTQPAASLGLQAVSLPAATTPKDIDSTVMAAFAKKEAEFVRRQEAFKKEREVWEKSEKAKADEIIKREQQFEELRKTNPIEAAKLKGFTETELFNYLAAQEKKELTPEEKAVEAAKAAADERIKAFEDNQKKQQEDALKKRDGDLIGGFKSEMTKIVESNADDFRFCKYFGDAAQSWAYDFVLECVKTSEGADIPTAEEAIKAAEEYYEEEFNKMSALKKKEAEAVAPAKPSQERTRTVSPAPGADPLKPTITKTRTLSNAATATSASAMKRVNETPSQKKERLIEALRRGSL